MTKRILNVVWGGFPDIRLEKTGRLLGEAGYQVDILCLKADSDEWQWGNVLEAKLPGSIPVRAVRRLITTLKRNATEFPWRYFAAFEAAFKAGNYDIVLWNDLPGVVEASAVVHDSGAKLVFDMHENYAENMWSTERDEGKTSFRYNVNAWLRYEKAALSEVDRVLVNIDEMGERLIGMHSVAPDKISVVRNAEAPDIWPKPTPPQELVERYKGKQVMLFVGSCSPHRGLDVIIRAMAMVRNQLPDLRLVIVGDGVGVPEWKALTKSLDVDDIVAFEGRKPFKVAQQYYGIADFGVIPHQKYGQTDNGIPHKLAQNLINGLPVLVSSCHCLERMVKQEGIGLVFRSGYPESAAKKILEMISSDEKRDEQSNAALEVSTSGVFSWPQMGRDIVSAFQDIG